jgi:RsiW-degrading membrane proteinase PrsW (M82 family)
MVAVARPDPEKSRRLIGLLLYLLGMGVGAALFILLFIVPTIFGKDPGAEFSAMGLGAVIALPALAVYLWIPWMIDRYDPEPWWVLLCTLLWGGIAAIGIAGFINTGVDILFASIGGQACGSVAAGSISAPFAEEFWKGMGVFGIFFFLRREFDGVVDGIIYATFAALGFAAIENVTYYQRAALADPGMNVFGATVFMRGIMSPWIHPLFTSMTGIGFGIARETNKGWLKWMAPILGYLCAVFLHSTWNTAATISGFLTIVMLPIWFIMLATFFGILIWLVRRKGRIIRQNLQDEVLLGNLTPWELELVCSAFGRMRATMNYGGMLGRKFVGTAARLGLSKWHAARAWQGQKRTVSADWIVPLRQELYQLREEIARTKGGNIQRPQAWSPPQQQQAYGQPAQQYVQPQGYPPGGYPPGGGGQPPPQGWR